MCQVPKKCMKCYVVCKICILQLKKYRKFYFSSSAHVHQLKEIHLAVHSGVDVDFIEEGVFWRFSLAIFQELRGEGGGGGSSLSA